jgi:hypothetical protein
VYGCYQARELLDSDAIFRQITADDLRHDAWIDPLCRAFVRHLVPTKRLLLVQYRRTRLFSILFDENIFLRITYEVIDRNGFF